MVRGRTNTWASRALSVFEGSWDALVRRGVGVVCRRCLSGSQTCLKKAWRRPEEGLEKAWRRPEEAEGEEGTAGQTGGLYFFRAQDCTDSYSHTKLQGGGGGRVVRGLMQGRWGGVGGGKGDRAGCAILVQSMF